MLMEMAGSRSCERTFIYPERMKGWVGLVGWPTANGLSGHPLVAGRAQDRESSPVKDQRSTTVPRNQPKTPVWPSSQTSRPAIVYKRAVDGHVNCVVSRLDAGQCDVLPRHLREVGVERRRAAMSGSRRSLDERRLQGARRLAVETR